MSFQMAPQPCFSKDKSVKIVELWYKFKDLDKVLWRCSKGKGIKKFPRKLPNVFKCVIDMCKNTWSIKMIFWTPWTRARSGEP